MLRLSSSFKQKLLPFGARALSSDPAPEWKWIPPPSRPQQTLEEESLDMKRISEPKTVFAKQIPIIKGNHLTALEVMDAFSLNGAENIVQKPCGSLADAMVIATGKSSAHARMLAQLIVKATKERRLKTFNPQKPIEGEDDWFLVDTGKLFVHVFGDESVREKIGLEQHLDNMANRSKGGGSATMYADENSTEKE